MIYRQPEITLVGEATVVIEGSKGDTHDGPTQPGDNAPETLD